MEVISYLEQVPQWPESGAHIMADYDDGSIVVYQAYKPSIAKFAVENQFFGGEFSYQRMSWIKPNFLWMMYRSGWATKEGQENILAIRISRPFFNEILQEAVSSRFEAGIHTSVEDWQAKVARSDVRLQWDPDHDPHGNPVARRAIQLGLRGEFLKRYGKDEVIAIADITEFVIEQRANLSDSFKSLIVPVERIYPMPGHLR